MRALVFDGKTGYRSEYPAPVSKENEALVKVMYAGVCATDLEIIKGYMGFKGILGHEFSGVVDHSHDPKLNGKRVAGEINLSCAECSLCKNNLRTHCPQRKVLGIYKKDGAFADYLTLPVENLHVLPDSVTDEEAVFIEPLAAAFEITEQVKVDGTKKVCVLGDGRLGLLVAQVLSLTGCSLVAVGRHREKLSILKAMGIETRIGMDGLGRDFDVVVDCTGSSSGFDAALKALKPRGMLVLKTTVAERGAIDLNPVVIDEITVVGSRCGPFEPAIKALEERRVDVKPLIERVFSLEDGVEALDYASKKGVLKVLLRVG